MYAAAVGKPKRKRKKPPGRSGPPVQDDATRLADLEARSIEIAAADPDAAGPLWGAVHKLLLKTSIDASAVAHLVTTRDVAGLSRQIRILKGEEAPEAVANEEPAAPAVAAVVEPETLKKAMRAFRKRLKLVRLDHESRLGVGPLTGGKKAEVDAIMPPHEFPDDVWQALVAEGKLRSAGPGFYELVDESGSA